MGIRNGKEFVESLRDDAPVQEVRAGSFWTAVLSRRCGLAATPSWEHTAQGLSDDLASRLAGMPAATVARLALSTDPCAVAIGVAAINSLLTVEPDACVDLNAMELIASRGRGRHVAMVGHFPFVPDLRSVVGRLSVLELHPQPGDLPAEVAAQVIPDADVVAITGSTIVNGTLDHLLTLCRPKSLVIVLGPSTPFSPVLFDYGVDVVSGTLVEDEQAVLQHVSAGVSFRQMTGVRLVTMLRDGRGRWKTARQ